MLTPNELATVSGTKLFKGLPPLELRSLIESGRAARRTFARGALIYTPDSYSRELGIILSGSVLVTKGALTVSELREGDMFGAAALFNSEPRYASTITALTDCAVLFVGEQAMTGLLDSSPQVRMSYVRYLSERIRFLSARVDALSAGSGEGKLARYLLANASTAGSLTVRSMTELASRLGMGRASLYRELDKLTDRGAISRTGKTITLLKPELLQ